MVGVIALVFVFDLVLWLSVHQKCVYNGKSDPCGAVHITIGDGGNKEGLAHRLVNVLEQ